MLPTAILSFASANEKEPTPTAFEPFAPEATPKADALSPKV